MVTVGAKRTCCTWEIPSELCTVRVPDGGGENWTVGGGYIGSCEIITGRDVIDGREHGAGA